MEDPEDSEEDEEVDSAGVDMAEEPVEEQVVDTVEDTVEDKIILHNRTSSTIKPGMSKVMFTTETNKATVPEQSGDLTVTPTPRDCTELSST